MAVFARDWTDLDQPGVTYNASRIRDSLAASAVSYSESPRVCFVLYQKYVLILLKKYYTELMLFFLYLSGVQFSGPHSVRLSRCVDVDIHGERLEQESGGVHAKGCPFALTIFINLLAT